MKIAIILPTRGLVFTEVEIAIEKMRQEHWAHVYRSFNRGIPDGHNYLTEQALRTKPDYLFFIEEDTVPPDEALQQLLLADADIAFIDYAVNTWSCSARTSAGTILWCGLGCTLVKRHVFDKLSKPYFRTDKTLRLNDNTWVDRPAKYGGQDIWFCTQARNNGYSIEQVPGECRHLQLAERGAAGVNAGVHNIIQRLPISKQQIVELTSDETHATVTVGNTPRR